MPKVRASSATIGTMRGPSVLILQQIAEAAAPPPSVVDIVLAVGRRARNPRRTRAAGSAAARAGAGAPADSRRAPLARSQIGDFGAVLGGSIKLQRARPRRRSAAARSDRETRCSAVEVELLGLMRGHARLAGRRPCQSPSWSWRGSPSACPCRARRGECGVELAEIVAAALQRVDLGAASCATTSARNSGSSSKKCCRL